MNSDSTNRVAGSPDRADGAQRVVGRWWTIDVKEFHGAILARCSQLAVLHRTPIQAMNFF